MWEKDQYVHENETICSDEFDDFVREQIRMEEDLLTQVTPQGAPAVLKSTTLINEHDVLCGRGRKGFRLGNNRFRSLLLQLKPAYRRAGPLMKKQLALRAVTIVRLRGGRFLQPNKVDGSLEEVGEELAVAKALRALSSRD